MEIEIAPGHVWTVWYEWVDAEGKIEPMVVATMLVDQALEEAHYSLSSAGVGYTILGLLRSDRLT
jgi:hypothetical protein